jgi:hypothetical protein
MPDQFTDVSSQSWFGRIGSAFTGLLFGVILIPVSVILLFWNEGRAVKTEKSLKEGAASVVAVQADKVAPENDKKLIHLSGEVAAGEAIHDPLFKFSAEALRISRKVEMYQWKEAEHKDKHKNLGGSEETVTTYTYTKEWSDKLIASSEFKHPEDHTNPTSFPVQQVTVLNSKATLGAFKIPQGLIAKMQGGEPLKPTEEALASLSPDLKSKARIAGDGVYFGADAANAVVGDARVTFLVRKPGTFSFLGQQLGDSLAPYPTKAGRDIERVEAGEVSAAAMFQHAESENSLITWLVRAGGFIAMFIGLAAILNPLKVFADIVPFIGSIIGFGTGLVALMLAVAGSLIVIAVAWLAARPLLGGTLLVLGVAAVIHAFMRVRRHHLATIAAGVPRPA